jgi:hypothetical protein
MKPMPPQSSGILNRIKKQNSINRPMPNIQQAAAQATSQQSPVGNLGNRMGSVINNRVPSQNFQRLRSMVNEQTIKASPEIKPIPQQTQPANPQVENVTQQLIPPANQQAAPQEQNAPVQQAEVQPEQLPQQAAPQVQTQVVSPLQQSNQDRQQLINNQVKKINRSNFGKIGF